MISSESNENVFERIKESDAVLAAGYPQLTTIATTTNTIEPSTIEMICGKSSILLRENGDIEINGTVVTNNIQVVDGMAAFLAEAGHFNFTSSYDKLKHENEQRKQKIAEASEVIYDLEREINMVNEANNAIRRRNDILAKEIEQIKAEHPNATKDDISHGFCGNTEETRKNIFNFVQAWDEYERACDEMLYDDAMKVLDK